MKARFVTFIILIFSMIVLPACGGTLSVEFDATATPDLSHAATLTALETRVATLEPGPQLLDLNASSEDIRLAMLNSHAAWQTLWLDAAVVWYAPEGAVESYRNQLWVDRPSARFRSVVGPWEGTPTVLQVADGTSILDLSMPDLNGQIRDQPPFTRQVDWTAPQQVSDTVTPYPLDMAIDAPVSEMIFPAALAQRGGTYTPTEMERMAGRPALVVEWSPGEPDSDRTDRFWLDTVTGVPLRWQGFQKGQGENGQVKLLSEITVNQLEYDLEIPPSLFDLQVRHAPMFALDASGDTGPTPVPPQAEFVPGAGELYFVIDNAPDVLQLVRLPGNCVTGPDPCPEPQPVEGYPNQNSTIEPLVWSPDGSQAVLVHQGELYNYTPSSGEWKALAAFPYVMAPVWSPDGLWVAFVAQIADDEQDVYAIRPDGSDLQNLTNGEFSTPETHLWVGGWLSDGRVLVQVIDRMTNHLYAGGVGEGQLQPLDSTAFSGVIAVAPTGDQLVVGEQTGSGAVLSLVPISGGEPRRLASFQQSGVQQVMWSPDGTRIVFLISTGTGPENSISTVYAIRTDGTDLRQLFQQSTVGRLTMTTDGRFLIAEGTATSRLVVIPIEDGASRTLDIPGVRLDQRMWGASYR